MQAWFFLASAIIAEVVATSALKSAEGFTRLAPSVIVVLGYGTAFYCLSMTLKTIPIALSYAIWSGLGIVLIAIVAFFLYQQRLDWPAIAGITLIVLGVLIIQLFSKTVVNQG